MEAKVTVAPLIGENTKTHWAQTVKTKYAYGVVETISPNGDAQSIGMAAVAAIADMFGQEVPAYSRIPSMLESLMSEEMRTILILVPTGNVATLYLLGKGTVYLKRGQHIAKILDTPGDISGDMVKGDIYFLLSHTCKETVLETDLLSSFDHLPALDVAEKVMVSVHKKSQESGYAGLFVEIVALEDTSWKEATIEPVAMSVVRQPLLFHDKFKKSGRWLKQRIRSVKSNSWGTNVKIIAVLVVIFLLCVGIGLRNEFMKTKNSTVTQAITTATKLIDEGEALLPLNAIKSKEKFTEALNALTQVQSNASEKTKEGRQIIALMARIQESLPKAANIYVVTPELFFDPSLLKAGVSPQALAVTDTTLMLLDGKERTVMSVDIASKNGQIVGGGAQLSDGKYIDIHGTSAYVFSENGIHVVNVGNKSVAPNVIKKSQEWGTIAGLTAFGGNVYLLDSTKGRIWKYIAVDTKVASGSASGFSDIREYLNPDSFPDFSKATSMSIDGSVWVGTGESTVYKFTQGKEDSFVPQGVDPPLGANLIIFTDDNSTYLYVLDGQNKRVVVLEKDGTYKGQYQWELEWHPTGLVVSEKQGKILLLAEGKIYAITIK